MEKLFRYILYFILGIIVLGILFLFIFRSSVIDSLESRAGLVVVPEAKVVVMPESLDTSILKSPSFKALKDNITDFHFDRICSKLVVAPQAVELSFSATDSAATSIEVNPASGCSLGNGLPFVVPEPKNN